MTIEQKLQDYILDKYKSVMQFAKLVIALMGSKIVALEKKFT